jgi:uncharacterized protein (TIGR03435 family)
MRFWLLLGFSTLALAPLFGQSRVNGPRFLGADIHTSPPAIAQVMHGPFLAANRYELRSASMLDLIHLAYDVDAERIVGGPAWIEMDRFDIFAKTLNGSTPASRKLMLRALLTERFHLATNETTKPMPAWALSAARHSGLKEADGSGDSGCRFSQAYPPLPTQQPQNGDAPRRSAAVFSFDCKNVTMAVLASTLANAASAQGYLQGKSVVDRTGLQGSWDFSFRYTQQLPASAQASGENIPLTDAMEKQLGLRLELSTAATRVVIIDHVDENPTPNPANLAEILPPVLAEFEVATIKPSPKTATQAPGFQFQIGRFVATNVTLRRLLQVAWGHTTVERLAGPKWMDDDRFDIIAKAPAEIAIGDTDNPTSRSNPLNLDAIRPMLRALLISRFKIEFHMEDRPLNALTLTARHPKLAKADPSERTKCIEGTGEADPKNLKNAHYSFGRVVTCQNVSMAQFVELLPRMAGAYVQTDVLNQTGLEGGWDFSFSFSPLGLLNNRLATAAPDNPPSPTAPSRCLRRSRVRLA